MEKYYRQYRTNGYQSLAHISRRPGILVCLVAAALLLLLWFQFVAQRILGFVRTPMPIDLRHDFDGRWIYSRDRNNIMLDNDQCAKAFPRLFDEIDRAAAIRQDNHIKVEELDSIEPKNGFIRAMIYDQSLYIIATKGNIYSRELATLHAIHRAIISSPRPLPNIEFAFNTDDVVFETVPLWAYARRRQGNEHLWLIPDFGYWSWPETKVGTMREDQMKAVSLESSSSKSAWSSKIPRALWRGATMGLPLRDRLLAMTRDKPWADVVALDWHNPESMAHDLVSMSAHCGFKYLLHTEGNSYSGRLKYLQACRSVIIAHEMDWIQHHHPLMNAERGHPEQNYVEVDRDFDGLEDAVAELLRDDAAAKRIATNSVRTFRERYLTPAAEACYWRRLFHAWREVSFEPAFYVNQTATTMQGEWRGLPFESFALERRLHWDPY